MNRTDRHDRCRRVDRHAAAVQVVKTHHAVNVGVFRQQIALNNFHNVIHYARHAMHAGGDAKQVFGSHAAIRIAVTFEGITLQRRQRLRDAGSQRQRLQRRGGGQLNQRLLNPATLRDSAHRIADDFAVAHDFTLSRDIDQCDFMPLRNVLNQLQAIRKAGASF